MKTLTVLIAILLTWFSLGTMADQSDSFQSKDWIWSRSTDDDNFYYAATANSAGNMLGQYCYLESGNCVYIVHLGIACDAGSEYPALISSAAGAVHVTLRCKSNNAFFVEGFDAIDRAVRGTTSVGIVAPLQSGEFTVSRFSLAGSTSAIDRMRAATQVKLQQTRANSSAPSQVRI